MTHCPAQDKFDTGAGRTSWESVLRGTGRLKPCLWVLWLLTGAVLFHGQRDCGFQWPHPGRRHPALGPYTLKKSSPISSLIRPPFTSPPLPLPVDSMLENILLTNRLYALGHHSFWWNRNKKNYIVWCLSELLITLGEPIWAHPFGATLFNRKHWEFGFHFSWGRPDSCWT